MEGAGGELQCSSSSRTETVGAGAAVADAASGGAHEESEAHVSLGFPVAAVRAYPSSRSSSSGSIVITPVSEVVRPRGPLCHHSSRFGCAGPPYIRSSSMGAGPLAIPSSGDWGPPPQNQPGEFPQMLPTELGVPFRHIQRDTGLLRQQTDGGRSSSTVEGASYSVRKEASLPDVSIMQQTQQQIQQQHNPISISAPAAMEGPSARGTDKKRGETKGRDKRSRGVILVMVLFLLLQITFNVDNGIVPAVLPQLWEEFHLADAQQGLLGALPYVGTALVSPLNSRLFNWLHAKCFLCISICCNALACCLFAGARGGPCLLVARLLVGATQAPFVIYAPVWVDAFAPEDQLTLWMGLLQGSVVLGVMLGYLAAGFLRNQGEDWRIAVYGQLGLLLLLLLLLISFVHPPLFDVQEQHRKERQQQQEQHQLLEHKLALQQHNDEETPEGDRQVSHSDSVLQRQHQQQQQQPISREMTAGGSPGKGGALQSHLAFSGPPAYAAALCIYRGTDPLPLPQQSAGDVAAVAAADGRRPATVAADLSSPHSSALGVIAGRGGPQGGSLKTRHIRGRTSPAPSRSQSFLRNTLVYPLTPSTASLALLQPPEKLPSGGRPAGPPRGPSITILCSNSHKDSTKPQLQRYTSAPPKPLASPVGASSFRQGPPSRSYTWGRYTTQEGDPRVYRGPLTMEQLQQQQQQKEQQQQQVEQQQQQVEVYIEVWGNKNAAAAAVASEDAAAAAGFHAAGGRPLCSTGLGWAVSVSQQQQNEQQQQKDQQQQQQQQEGGVRLPLAGAAGSDDVSRIIVAAEAPSAAVAAVAAEGDRDTASVDSVPGEVMVGGAEGAPTAITSPRRLSAPSIVAAATAAAATAAATSHARFSLLVLSESKQQQQVQQLQQQQQQADQLGPPVEGPSVAGPSVAGPSVAGPSVAGPSVAGPSGSRGSSSAPTAGGAPKDSSDHSSSSNNNRSSSSTKESVRRWILSQVKSLASKAAVGIDLLRNPIYALVVGGLCSLFLEVTAIQFWSTKYFEQVLHVPTATVLLSFSITAVTAPLLGILMGGVLVDKKGGYKEGPQRFMSLFVVSALAGGCVLCGAVAAATSAFAGALAAIWLVLFLGGGILPPATGIVLACIEPERRTDASGFAIFIYTIFGYMLGSFLPGVLNDLFGLAAGMRVSLLWSIFGFLEFAAAAVVAWRQQGAPDEDLKGMVDEEGGLPPASSLSEGEIVGEGSLPIEGGAHLEASSGTNTHC